MVCCAETKCLQGEQAYLDFFFFLQHMNALLSMHRLQMLQCTVFFLQMHVYTDTQPAINQTPLQFFFEFVVRLSL